MTKVLTLQEVRLNGEEVPAGVEVEIEDEYLPRWLERGLAAPISSDESSVYYQSLSGGWYVFPDGTKVRGKEALEEYLKARESGDQNDAPTQDGGTQESQSSESPSQDSADSGTGDAIGGETLSEG